MFEIDTFLGNTRLKQATGINVVRDREKSGYLDDISQVECLDVNYKFGFGKKNTVGNDANRTFVYMVEIMLVHLMRHSFQS